MVGTKLERALGGPSWNGLWGVQVMAHGCPKMAQIDQQVLKWRFEGSGGLERLEHHGKMIVWTFHNPFHLHSMLFPTVQNHQNLQIAMFRHFWPYGLFGRPWAKFGGAPLLQIGPKTSTWTSHSLFQLRYSLFQPFGTTKIFKSPSWAYLGHFWAV